MHGYAFSSTLLQHISNTSIQKIRSQVLFFIYPQNFLKNSQTIKIKFSQFNKLKQIQLFANYLNNLKYPPYNISINPVQLFMNPSHHLPLTTLKINQQFRKQIRKRDIDTRFTQRRKQLLQDLTLSTHLPIQLSSKSTDCPLITNQSSQDTAQIITQFQHLYSQYTTSKIKSFQQYQLKIISAISCTITGAQLLLSLPISFFIDLFNYSILPSTIDSTHEQAYSLVVISNCLAITDIGYKIQNKIKYSKFNQFTTQENVILKLFSISQYSNCQSSRQTALTCIFSIIYNNDSTFALQLLINPKYTIMTFLPKLMQTLPTTPQIIQILNIFYIMMKKLKFDSVNQFINMENIISNQLKNSNSKEVVALSVVCLHALLKCLPNQKINIAKTSILQQLFSHSLTQNNIKITIYSLRIATLLLQSQTQQQLKQTITFIQQVINQFTHEGTLIMAFKTFHQILIHTQPTSRHLLTNTPKLFNKMIELFSSNLTNKVILNEISSILTTIVLYNKNVINSQLFIQINQRVQQILGSECFDDVTHHYLSIIDKNNQIQCL